MFNLEAFRAHIGSNHIDSDSDSGNMRELDPLVSEYQHEKQRPREAEALRTLRKVVSLVKPIMRQRSWRVGTVCEFYPDQANLLGLNVNWGEKICLRLRQPYDQTQFVPMEQVIDTMLHELCHIVHGPHDQQFHALWNQLRDEHEQLLRKGYTGEGFLSEGKRLGGRSIPLDEARRLARAAAEKRRILTAGSGKKLGGASILPGADVRRVVADAAQRRLAVTQGCASGTSEGDRLADDATRNGFKTKAEMDDANERAIMEAYIDLIQEEEKEQYGSSYSPPSASNPAGPRGLSSPPPVPTFSKPTLQSQQSGLPELPFSSRDLPGSLLDHVDPSEPWSCQICTLVNKPMFLSCEACGCERTQPPDDRPALKPKQSNASGKGVSKPPKPASRPSLNKTRKSAIENMIELEKNAINVVKQPLGWVCHRCGTFMESQWWTCSACGVMKLAG
ncbi:hypothetical protein FQN57_001912 [Myotisia sp. PD_48]|nr:hypothetical protein FQN57_001912 [Myotisia sp. PD_48]